MKNKIYLAAFFLHLFTASFVRSQSVLNHTNLWYFNFYCGLDFTGGNPVSINNSALSTYEGSTSICDSNNNLLFYTGSTTLYNANHQVMVNGSGLHGNASSTQACVAVPKPGSPDIWYLFTVDASGGGFGAQYSVIDMSLQGGLGEVTQKNLPLISTADEKVTATYGATSSEYWVMYLKYQTNQFYAYPVTSAGVGTPVITSTGTISNDFRGAMKFSPDGKRLAVGKYDLHSFDIFDFDKTTGIPTFSFTISLPVGFRSYGVEWSRNSKRLYMGNVDYNPGQVYEVNMDLPTPTDIIASLTLISSISNLLGSLQMGPDGKIYVVQLNLQALDVINQPDSMGAACNYVISGCSTAPHANWLGLPNYIMSWFDSQNTLSGPSAAFTVSDTSLCQITCIDFTDASTNNPTSWQWSFPGGNPSSSTLQNPTNICYNTSGTYDVTLIASNSFGSDTITLSNFITVNTAPTANITQSNDTLYSSAGNSYQWYTGGNAINGATDDFYVPSTEDFYSVVITDANGCTAADTIFFSLSPQTSFAASDTTICQKFCMDFFDQSGNNPTTWQWSFPGGIPSSSNQQNPTQICYNNPGVYDVTLITTNSFGSDTLVLTGYITVYSTPAFPTITVTGDILTSSYASSYQWQFNSVDIPGATNQSYTATQTGYYTVIITDENGCVSSTTVFVEVTGIENIAEGFGFSLYPNPSNGNFTIEFSGAAISETISIEVVNALGQKIFSSEEKNILPGWKKEFVFNVEGIYFIEIRTANYFLKEKVLVSP